MIPFISELLASGSAAQVVAGVLLLLGGAVFAVCGTALSLIDLREHRLPNRIVYPWAAVTFAVLLLATFLLTDAAGLGRAVISGAIWGAIFWGVVLLADWLGQEWLGAGDAKLAVVLGMYSGFLGWQTLGAAVVLSFVLGGLVSVGLMVTGRAHRKTHVPFGPFMIVGTAVALIIS